jgi:hypothetical protein
VGPALPPIFPLERATLVAVERAARGLIALSGAALVLVLRRPLATALSRATLVGMLRAQAIAIAVAQRPRARVRASHEGQMDHRPADEAS